MTIIEEINATFSASEEEKKKLGRSFRKEPFFKKEPVWEPRPDDVKKHYKELEKRLKSGNIPEEWQKIWSDIREIVRYLFLKDPAAIPQCTALKIDVTSSYYYKYFIIDVRAPKMKKYSVGRLLNGYLTRQLKKEGFKKACLRLVQERGNPWAKQMNENARAAYERELREWQEKKAYYDSVPVNEIMGGAPAPGKAPAEPTYYSSTETQYYFHLLCSRDKESRIDRGIKDAEFKETEATMRRVIR